VSNLRPDKLPIWETLDEAGVNQRVLWERGQVGYPLFGDYTLRTLSIDDRGLALSRPAEDPMRLPPIAAPEKLEVRAENPVRYVLDVGATQPWTLRLHRPYFPGWQVTVDGAPVDVAPGGVGGLVSAELPAGDYRVVASLGDNDVRRAANTISIVALAIWLVWLLPWRRWWLDAVLVIVLSVAIGALITYLQTDGRFARYPLTTQAHFDAGIRLVGLELPTTTVCAEDELALRLYWFTDRTPRTDYKIFMHVTTLDDTGKVAQIDTMPFDSFNPMTRWEPGELVDFAQTIPLAGVTPGRYRVLLGLYDQETGQNLRVENATFLLARRPRTTDRDRRGRMRTMSTRRDVNTRRQRWLEIGFVVLLFLVALLLRTWQLDRFPPGLYNDEAAYGMDGRALLAGDLRIFYERNNGREPLFIYLLALAFQSLGATAYAIRLTAAVVGAVTVVTSYWMVRELFRFAPETNDATGALVCGVDGALSHLLLLAPQPEPRRLPRHHAAAGADHCLRPFLDRVATAADAGRRAAGRWRSSPGWRRACRSTPTPPGEWRRCSLQSPLHAPGCWQIASPSTGHACSRRRA
jgi:hypothetical protein